jgi:hypothetical protein
MHKRILYEVNYLHNRDGSPYRARMFITIPRDYDHDPEPVMKAIRARIEQTVTGRYVIETIKKIVKHGEALFTSDFIDESRQIAMALGQEE